MEIRQIRQQLTQVDLIIHRATLALRDDKAAPQELKDYVQQLGDQSQQAQQTLQEAQDAAALMQFIAEMEHTSDRAKAACENARELSPQAKSAIQLAHRQVTSLKYQLH